MNSILFFDEKLFADTIYYNTSRTDLFTIFIDTFPKHKIIKKLKLMPNDIFNIICEYTNEQYDINYKMSCGLYLGYPRQMELVCYDENFEFSFVIDYSSQDISICDNGNGDISKNFVNNTKISYGYDYMDFFNYYMMVTHHMPYYFGIQHLAYYKITDNIFKLRNQEVDNIEVINHEKLTNLIILLRIILNMATGKKN